MTVLVGTASWTDKTLITSKKFYPKGCSTAEARLRFYAAQFPLVEVDSSYYAMPASATAQLWADRTPEGFTMNVKAFRLFTGHQTEPKALHADIQQALGPKPKRTYYYRDLAPEIRDELWRRFLEALKPLQDASKLGLVHFQFAPWLLPDPEGRAHIVHCIEKMADHTVSIEFRQRTWFDSDRHTEQTLGMLRELHAVHTVVDGPQGFSNSVPAVWSTTHPKYALVRMHGHNADTWNIEGAKSASDRFNYDYPDGELAGIASNIGRLEDQVEFTHVILNNNMEDQGQRNAATLTRILRERTAATLVLHESEDNMHVWRRA